MSTLIKTSTGKLIKKNNILIKSPPQPDVIVLFPTDWNIGVDKDYQGHFTTRGGRRIDGYVCIDVNNVGHMSEVSDYTYGLALFANTQTYEMLVSYVDTNTTLTSLVAKQETSDYVAIGDADINWESEFDLFISENEHSSSDHLTRQEFINDGWILLATIKFICDFNGNPRGFEAWTTTA